MPVPFMTAITLLVFVLAFVGNILVFLGYKAICYILSLDKENAPKWYCLSPLDKILLVVAGVPRKDWRYIVKNRSTNMYATSFTTFSPYIQALDPEENKLVKEQMGSDYALTGVIWPTDKSILSYFMHNRLYYAVIADLVYFLTLTGVAYAPIATIAVAGTLVALYCIRKLSSIIWNHADSLKDHGKRITNLEASIPEVQTKVTASQKSENVKTPEENESSTE